MIDYIRVNLWHEPGCQYKLPYYEMPCTCRHAKALEWLERREAFVEAFKDWRECHAQSAKRRERKRSWVFLDKAFARLEGE